MQLRFGKHKGKDLTEVPLEYLDWLLTQDWLYPNVRLAVQREVDDRVWAKRQQRTTAPSGVKTPREVDPVVALQVIQEGLRALALKHHPDHGGQTEIMQDINVAVDWLRSLVHHALPVEAHS